jgi:mRNA interferase MazF
MAEFSFGEIAIVDFPFSDGVQSKPRPALVLTMDSDGDLLVARITGNPPEPRFDVVLYDWYSSNLMFESVVRVSKLATLLPSAVKRKIGKLSSHDRERVIAALRTFVDSLD